VSQIDCPRCKGRYHGGSPVDAVEPPPCPYCPGGPPGLLGDGPGLEELREHLAAEKNRGQELEAQVLDLQHLVSSMATIAERALLALPDAHPLRELLEGVRSAKEKPLLGSLSWIAQSSLNIAQRSTERETRLRQLLRALLTESPHSQRYQEAVAQAREVLR
jgi:hypothetical protein